jgi:hypothetical protein
MEDPSYDYFYCNLLDTMAFITITLRVKSLMVIVIDVWGGGDNKSKKN